MYIVIPNAGYSTNVCGVQSVNLLLLNQNSFWAIVLRFFHLKILIVTSSDLKYPPGILSSHRQTVGQTSNPTQSIIPKRRMGRTRPDGNHVSGQWHYGDVCGKAEGTGNRTLGYCGCRRDQSAGEYHRLGQVHGQTSV